MRNTPLHELYESTYLPLILSFTASITELDISSKTTTSTEPNGAKLSSNPDSITVVLQEVSSRFKGKRNRAAFLQLPELKSFRRNESVMLRAFVQMTGMYI